MNNCKPTIIIAKLPTGILFFVSIFILPQNTFPVNQIPLQKLQEIAF